jgi:signal transduction histidine kinase
VGPLFVRVRSRLVLYIYLTALLQFVAVAAIAGALLASRARPPRFATDLMDFVAESVSSHSDTNADIQSEIDRAHGMLHWSLAVYGEDGDLLAVSGAFEPPTPSRWSVEPEEVQSLPGPSLRGARVVRLGAHGTGHMLCAMPGPGVPQGPWSLAVVVLVVVGIGSALAARGIAAPLARLAAVTRAFGAGDLSARVSMKRSDELGDLARAFDDMADRVTKSIRAERELLANVSHELRTPLQRIHIAVELASEGNAETARESLADIAEDLGELERLVDDVLVATRLSLAGGTGASSAIPPIRPAQVDVSALLDRVVARFRAAHPARTLQLSLPGDMPAILADPVLIRRVIENLLENSHKYTEDEVLPISVAARLDGPWVVLEVRDHGVGIAPDDLERVFEPFFRADRSRTRASGGLGLGLALARRIVESHGGRLTLDSTPGRGTSARVELPREMRTV